MHQFRASLPDQPNASPLPAATEPREMAEPRSDDVFIRCTRKEGHSFSKAKRIARRMRRTSDDVVVEYHCDHCKMWHVGSMERKKQVRQEKRRGRDERTERS